MQSSTNREEVEHRIGLLLSLCADLRLGGRRVWIRLDSNTKHDAFHEDYPPLEEVIGVDKDDMAEAFNKKGNTWRKLFKGFGEMKTGFIEGEENHCVFVSVASTEKGVEEDALDLSPVGGLKMDKEMMIEVKSKLKAARKLSNLSSRPKKRTKAVDDSNISTGTPAEPATTSTPASEPNAALRPKDGAPLLLSVPAAAPAAASQAAQSTVTPFHSAIPSQLTHGTPAVTDQPSSQHAAPLITTKKRSAKEISAEKGDFGHAPMLGPLKNCASSTGKATLFAQGVDIELNMESIAHDVFRLLRESLKSNSSIPKEFEGDVEAVAAEVLIDLASRQQGIMTDMTSTTIDGRSKTRTFTLVPLQRRRLDPESTSGAQRRYVRNKAKIVGDFVRACLPGKTAHEQYIARRVLDKVAQGYNGAVREKNYSFKTLDMKEAIIIRDTIGASTRGMVNLASMINAMRPELELDGYQLFQHCLAAKFALYESSNNLELVTEMFSLQVKKDDTLTKLLPFAYLKRPWELLEIMVENSILDNSFEPSEGWMNAMYSGKVVFSYNLDKGGNDIVCSARLLNRENGNSMKFTFPIAFVAGPVCECYENISITILDSDKPVQQTLQGLAYDSYFMVTLTVDGRENSQVRCMMFRPTPVQAPCDNRFFDASLSEESIQMSDDFQFDLPQSTSGGPPEVEIALTQGAIEFKPVMSGESSATGLQFIVDEKPVYTQRFRQPIDLSSDSKPKIRCEQVMGFNACDGKQVNQQSGNLGCQSICACTACMQQRINFGNWNVRLYELHRANEIAEGRTCPECPYESPKLREGELSPDKCYQEFVKATSYGRRQLTKDRARALNIKVGSICRKPLLIEPPQKNCGEPLHDSQGMIFHCFKHMRADCRKIDLKQAFFIEIIHVHAEVKAILQTLTLSSNNGQSVLAPLHSQNNRLALQVDRKLKEAEQLSLKRDEKLSKLNEDGDLEDDDDNDSKEGGSPVLTEVLEQEINELNQRIKQLYTDAEDLAKKCDDQVDQTKYGFYIQLQKGLSLLDSAITKFRNDKCKRPRGFLEFAFNNAIELFGGEFMAEHSGFELTNKNALNALENFESIASVVVAAGGNLSADVKAEVEARFEEFKDLASKEYTLLTAIKSQEKVDPDVFERKLLAFVLVHEKTFPGVDCYNKLHSVIQHYLDFVRRYNMCGRKSAESHESVHTLISRMKDAVKRMTSTEKMMGTIFSRSMVDLKPGVAETKENCDKTRGVGRKRGKYDNAKRSSRRQDDVAFSATIFEEPFEIPGENGKFVNLVGAEGCIHERFKRVYLYVKMARAPDEWVQGFVDIGSISAAKIEGAKYSGH